MLLFGVGHCLGMLFVGEAGWNGSCLDLPILLLVFCL